MKQFFKYTLTGTFGIAFYGLGIGLLVGGLYWLWMAARFGSVLMFVIGLIPPAYVVTAPVGLYSIFFGPPHWVSSYFGHAEQHVLSEETKNAYTQSCSASLVQQGLALDKGKVFCRCTINKVEAQFSGALKRTEKIRWGMEKTRAPNSPMALLADQ